MKFCSSKEFVKLSFKLNNPEVLFRPSGLLALKSRRAGIESGVWVKDFSRFNLVPGKDIDGMSLASLFEANRFSLLRFSLSSSVILFIN